jgi:ADP-ribosyl-[dinitrogen reductase] hydrolase
VPGDLVRRLHGGPFGPTLFRALDACLGQVREGQPCPVPGYSASVAPARNWALDPVILGHGLRRLVPF